MGVGETRCAGDVCVPARPGPAFATAYMAISGAYAVGVNARDHTLLGRPGQGVSSRDSFDRPLMIPPCRPQVLVRKVSSFEYPCLTNTTVRD